MRSLNFFSALSRAVLSASHDESWERELLVEVGSLELQQFYQRSLGRCGEVDDVLSLLEEDETAGSVAARTGARAGGLGGHLDHLC